MPDMTPSDIIAIVAIGAGVLGTLGGVVLGAWLQGRQQAKAEARADERARAQAVMQSRLRAIEDTQRYVSSMLDWISTLAIRGLGSAGNPPNLGDFPKVELALIGDSRLFAEFGAFVQSEVKRARDGGPPWNEHDNERVMRLGAAVTRALRKQEERVLAGEEPRTPSAEEQDREMRGLLASYRESPSDSIVENGIRGSDEGGA